MAYHRANVGWYIDFKNRHGTNNIKFAAYNLSSLFSSFLIKIWTIHNTKNAYKYGQFIIKRTHINMDSS
jgi:hypothetical protein